MNELMFYTLHQSFATLMILGSGCTVLFGSILVLFQRVQQRAMLTAQAKADLARTQLWALKAQMHPHFLFNTLNTISILTTQDPEKAQRMIVLLSDLLRQVLEASRTDEVTLKHEVDLLRGYIEIQQMRYCERIDVSFTIDPDILGAHVPWFTLQPLVENAIRHGIARRQTGGCISINASRHDGNLVIRVQDDGPGLSEEPNRTGSSCGIGLANTRKRLAYLYGNSASVEIERNHSKGTVTTVSLPYHEYGIA
jgi:sensor histidine kinase YesM